MKPQSVPKRLTPQQIGFRFVFRHFACVLLLAGCLSAVPALGSPAGELDPSFGDHGRILLHESEFEEFRGVDVFVDPASGSLLAVGSGWYGNTLLRFSSDGSVDNTFGNQGVVPLDIGDNSLEILDVEQLGDGKLLIAGAMNVYGDPDNVIHGSGLLARMHRDGSLDESFGSNGRAIFQLGGVYEALSEIMVQADGGIVVLGSTDRTGGIERILARYTENGLPDAGFGNGATPGIGVIDVAGIDANLAAIMQQRDGKFMACGNVADITGSSGSSEVLAIRIRPDGVPDSGFGNNGTISIAWQESVQIADCLELADGHLIFAGSSGSGEWQRAATMRLASDGRLDASFGNNGIVLLDTDLPSAATKVLVTSDGALAIAGSKWSPRDDWFSWSDMLVARIDPTSGAIDREFGDRGFTTVDFGSRGYPGVASAARVRQQPDGKLVIIGSQIDLYDNWYPAYSIAITRIDPYGSGSNGWAGLAATYANVPLASDSVTLNLRRTGGSTGQLSVDYRTVDGTATAGVDYVAGSGTVVWSDGELSEKSVSIAVLHAESVTDYRDLIIELFNSSGGLAVDQASISITPSESPSGSPPPATPPPVSSTNGGGGAMGFELCFLIVLAVLGVMKQLASAWRRATPAGLKPRLLRCPLTTTDRIWKISGIACARSSTRSASVNAKAIIQGSHLFDAQPFILCRRRLSLSSPRVLATVCCVRPGHVLIARISRRVRLSK